MKMTLTKFEKFMEDKDGIGVAVHCPNKNEAIDFFDILKLAGYSWANKESLSHKTLWNQYKSETCYCLRNKMVSYCSYSFYEGSKIYELKDIFGGDEDADIGVSANEITLQDAWEAAMFVESRPRKDAVLATFGDENLDILQEELTTEELISRYSAMKRVRDSLESGDIIKAIRSGELKRLAILNADEDLMLVFDGKEASYIYKDTVVENIEHVDISKLLDLLNE